MPKPDADRPTYPHLENLERVLVAHPDFLSRRVTVTEKIHGINVRVGKSPDGKIWVGTRNQDFDLASLDAGGIQGFVGFVREREASFDSLLPIGMTVFGEWAGKGVQKGIDYGEKRLYLFADKRFDAPVVSTIAALDHYWVHGLTAVPVFHEGVAALDVLEKLRDGESIAADGQPIEGVVIAPAVPVLNAYGGQVIAKFKSRRFSELTHVREARVSPDLSEVTAIAGEYVNFERLEHVLAKVVEGHPTTGHVGKIVVVDIDPLDVKFTGHVLRAMYADVLEDASDVVAGLSPENEKLLGKAINYATIPLLQAARDEAARIAVETAAQS